MPRLSEAKRADIKSADVLDVLERIFGDRDPSANPGTTTGTPGNWWTVMALEPGIFKMQEDRHHWQKSAHRELDPVLRELAIVRAGWARGSQFVFSQHCKVIRGLGVSEEKIQAIPTWQTTDVFAPVEALVLAYADDLVLGSGRVTDARFEALKTHLTDVAILELTFITCTYDMSATMSRALRLEYDDRDDPVIEVPVPETN
jgi:alkylhydroperoxidase family enzyme